MVICYSNIQLIYWLTPWIIARQLCKIGSSFLGRNKKGSEHACIEWLIWKLLGITEIWGVQSVMLAHFIIDDWYSKHCIVIKYNEKYTPKKLSFLSF